MMTWNLSPPEGTFLTLTRVCSFEFLKTREYGTTTISNDGLRCALTPPAAPGENDES